MILSIGIILTPWDWNFVWYSDEEITILVLGPIVITLERIDEW